MLGGLAVVGLVVAAVAGIVLLGGGLGLAASIRRKARTSVTPDGISIVGEYPVHPTEIDRVADATAAVVGQELAFGLRREDARDVLRGVWIETHADGVKTPLGTRGGTAQPGAVHVSTHAQRLFVPYLVHEWLHVLWWRGTGRWTGMHESMPAKLAEDRILTLTGYAVKS